MADLFLDTDYLGIVGPEKVADRIRPAGFSRDELQTMFVDDVLPAFAFNLCAFAGEWAGWGTDFVRSRIVAVRAKRMRVAIRFQAAIMRPAMGRQWKRFEVFL